ncbi:MAG: glycosyltransferase, partial [Kiritimatiellae bacterium]|nr:glycosyltransferase [Kiritimatiellia bacterium]
MHRSCNGRPPARERQVRDALRELAGIPGVTSHGFTAPDRVRETIGRADYYVGITAGETLMSRTGFRTGVAEALAAGGRLVHKETEG